MCNILIRRYGETSLLHLIMKGFSVARPPQTVGCTVSVKLTTYESPSSSSSSIKGDAEREFLLNSGTCQDTSAIKTVGLCFILKSMVSIHLSLVVKIDWFSKEAIFTKEGTRVSSGNLLDVARQWVEKQGLLPSSEELPLTKSFPNGGGLIAVSSAKEY